MLIEERLNKIKKIIQENKSISIESLVSKLEVSKDTIRRDLIRLEQLNVIKRTHGGAVINNRDALIFDYSQRSEIQNPVKERIAIKAAELIKDNSSVIFDSSTTVETVIPHLSDKNILAITNSLTSANRLAKNKKCDIKILPGNLHKEQMFLYGSETIQKIEKYHVDYVLLGVFAISDKGLFIHTEEEGLVKRQMVMQGMTVIAVADHTKINTTGFFKVCDLSWINYLVTDELPESSFIQSLQDNNVELILTNT
ncbi:MULTISPECIES: DeoR/GlpR family DNA-binding transcription regulator [Pantoea]|jgi:DeoR/GlpR family transcriptional regulator of sugar metabolism|uniref:DeoR/GlpR family DNA-binding transcription regulator n=1 Tax=Pantoea TaxID=53335 RepID=UPI00068E3086|nr:MULTISPECIES: DeoR/GlpR family DNA-binding transcription regulator [Pantoea]KOA70595.1 DeoR faimly transcriptional regulator [Pantoea sp. CFSAN033090]NYB28464.1 DeoR/GlpR transcriptional regulator [Pantoea agglomerans]